MKQPHALRISLIWHFWTFPIGQMLKQATFLCRHYLVRLLSMNGKILIYLVRRGKLRQVRLLLEAGADPNVKSKNGGTVLRTAVQNNHPEMVRALLQAGADPNLKAWGEMTTVLLEAVKGEKTEIVRALLQAGVDLEGKNFGNEITISCFTALTWAAYEGRANMVGILLEAGADPDKKDGHPSTRQYGYSGGWTALSVAAEKGHGDIVRMLLEAGADPGVENEEGETALALAAREGHGVVVRLLEEAGANDKKKSDRGDES